MGGTGDDNPATISADSLWLLIAAGLEALNSLTKLTGLSLQRSYVSSNGLSALTALSGIESLNVQHCMLSTRRPRRELTGIDAWAVGLPQAFASFRQLRHLDVSDCEYWTPPPPPPLRPFSCLDHIPSFDGLPIRAFVLYVLGLKAALAWCE